MSTPFDLKLALIEKLYRHTFRHIDPARLGPPGHWTMLGPERLAPPYIQPDSDEELFLDFYSLPGLEMALERYGFLDNVREQGFSDLRLMLHRAPEGYDILRLQAAECEQPLVELVAQVGPLPVEGQRLVDTGERPFLPVRWLRMQNPLRQAPAERPLLPGQDFPGLGLGRHMLALLQMICVRMDLDGMVALPERLHNAALYFRRFLFVDPKVQGTLVAILRDCRRHRLTELAWGVDLGGLYDLDTRKPFRWIPAEQVMARQGPAREYLDSEDYRRLAHEEMSRRHFRLSGGDLALEDAITSGALSEDSTGTPSNI